MAQRITKFLIYLFLVVLALLCIAPFLLMIVNATRSGTEITSGFTLIPGSSTGENMTVVFDYFNPFLGMLNSLLVAVPATLFSAYFSAMTAYGMAFYEFKGNKILFGVILVFMMIPGQLSLIGFFELCTKLRLVNSYIPLIVPAIASAGTVFFLKQYAESTVPRALLESARIMGANEFRIFNSIVLPIMGPAVSTMGIMGFIGNWNNYLLPMILISTPDKMTLPVMMATLRASTDINKNQGAIYLAVAISVVPILLVFAFFSKYIISSVTAGITVYPGTARFWGRAVPFGLRRGRGRIKYLRALARPVLGKAGRAFDTKSEKEYLGYDAKMETRTVPAKSAAYAERLCHGFARAHRAFPAGRRGGHGAFKKRARRAAAGPRLPRGAVRQGQL